MSEDDKLPGRFIPFTIKGDTYMLNDERMKILPDSYIGCYWQLRKNYLKFLKDSVLQGSFVGSTISTFSNKRGFHVLAVFLHQVFCHKKPSYQLINELQTQDSNDLDFRQLSPSKSALVCKLAQVPPEICMERQRSHFLYI
jgi:hypothetical protein